jgi:hypothetical protein
MAEKAGASLGDHHQAATMRTDPGRAQARIRADQFDGGNGSREGGHGGIA